MYSRRRYSSRAAISCYSLTMTPSIKGCSAKLIWRPDKLLSGRDDDADDYDDDDDDDDDCVVMSLP